VGAGEVSHTVSDDGSGDRDVAPSIELPDLLARVEVVGSCMMPAIDQNLRLSGKGGYIERAPGRHVVPSRSPKLFSVFQIKNGNKGILLHIALNDCLPVVDYGRAGESPLSSLYLEVACVHIPEIDPPAKLALHVETKEPFGSEVGDDVFAIGGGRGIAMGGFRMPEATRNAFVVQLVENGFAGFAIEGYEPPLMMALIIRRSNGSVESDLELSLPRSDCSGKIEPAVPDDWSRVSETRDRRPK